MWLRRQTTKFNGVPYIIQRGAEAVFSEEGIKQCRESIAYYQENARIIMEGFDKVGIKYYGGVHSPYIWLQCPNGMSSWEFFDFLLEKLQVVRYSWRRLRQNGRRLLPPDCFRQP